MALQGNFATKIQAVVTDLTSAEMVNINKAIYTDVFGITDFTSAHTFIPNVRQGSVIPIVNDDADFGAYPKGDARSCAMNNGTLNEVYDAKVWDLVELNSRYAICLKSLEEDFLVFWNKQKLVLEDPTQQPEWGDYVDFLTNKAVRDLKAAQWRQGYMGDTANASALVNGANGFFAQAEAMNGLKIDITKAGLAPTGEELYKALREGYEAVALEAWFDESTAIIKMTKTMAFTIVNFLNSLSDASQYDVTILNPNAIVAGRKFSIDGLHIFGLKVEVHSEIDRSMSAIGEANKFKAIIARKSNLLVGAPSLDKVEQLDIFYDRKDKNIYIDVATYFGVAIVTSEYVLIG